MKKKEGAVRVSYVLDGKVAKALDRFCEETGRTRTRVVEMAIMEFLKKHKKD